MVEPRFSQLVLLFWILWNVFYVADGQCARKKTPLARLREELFCNYDKLSRPVENSNKQITISYSIDIKRVSMEEHRQNMQVEATFRFTWVDAHIAWKPASYENISYMKIEDIWLPDLTMNVGNQIGVEELRPSQCTVSYKGVVSCMPLLILSAPCSQNVRRWPFSKHTCNFTVSSYLYYDHQLTLSGGNVYKQGLIANREWSLEDIAFSHKTYNLSTNSEVPAFYPVMSYQLTIFRHAGLYSACTVLPGIMLLAIVLNSFWLGNMLTCRLITLGFVVLSCSMFLSYLMYLVPPNGDSVPVIVTLFRDCLALATFGIVIAATVKRLSNSEDVPPLWLSSITDRVELSILGRVLFLANATILQDDETAIIEPSAKANLWALPALLLDRISFLISLIVASVLLAGYIP